MNDFEVRHLTSTLFKLPSPKTYVSPMGDYFFYLSCWGDCTDIDKVMSRMSSYFLTNLVSNKKQSDVEQLCSIFSNVNEFLLNSTNKHLWKTVFEVAAFKLNRNHISWAIAGDTAIYTKNNAKELVLLNTEFESKLLPFLSLQQETALPFFGLGLQSSFEIDSGHQELEPESSVFLLNSPHARQISSNLTTIDTTGALDQFSQMFPNSAAWASTFSMKS